MRGHPEIIDGKRFLILGIIMRPGRRPTIREICDEVGISINAVVCHLDDLRKKGLVTWEPGLSRTLRATCKVVKV